MQLRQRLHQIFFEMATISRLVCFSLLVIHNDWKEVKLLVGGILTVISSILLLILFVFYSIRKFRNNIAPLIFIIMIGLTGIISVPEIVLYGLVGLDKDGEKNSRKNDILVAGMTYVLVSLSFSIALCITLFVWPPIFEELPKKDGLKENGEQSRSVKDSRRDSKQKSSGSSQRSDKKQLSLSAKSRS